MKWLLPLLLIASCGAQPTPIRSALEIAASFQLLGAKNARATDVPKDAPIPRSFDSHAVFDIPEANGKTGQVFTCENKKNCDALVKYFEALAGLAGPWLYQSKGGRVVVQLSSQTPAEVAARYAATVQEIPY